MNAALIEPPPPPPEESLDAIAEIAHRVLDRTTLHPLQDSFALARIALDFVTMKREYAIMVENVSSIQQLSTKQEDENRALRSVLSVRLKNRLSAEIRGADPAAIERALHSEQFNTLLDLIRVRWSSDCKHGDARVQMGLPDGTGDDAAGYVEKLCRADLERRRATGTVTWLSILACERAEVDNATSDEARIGELLDEANVALKWIGAIRLRSEGSHEP